MNKIAALMFASLLGLGMVAHAAEADAPPTPKSEQARKLVAQAEKAHKKGDALALQAEKAHKQGDALAAQADRLEKGTGGTGEKMRGGSSSSREECDRMWKEHHWACGVSK